MPTTASGTATGSPGVQTPEARTSPLSARIRGVGSSPVRELLKLTQRPEVVSFAGGLPAPELFDVDGVRAAFDAVLSGPAARRSLQYATTEGDPLLRQRVAERLTRRGLPTDADDLLITTGSQQALSLIATAVLDPGDVVAVEAPTYLAAVQVLQLAGARLVPVATDEHGIDLADLERVIAEHSPKLLYVVPTFANPTGRTVPAERRAELARLAAHHGLLTIEDDPYGELRFRGEPVPAVASFPDAGEHVLYLGSFSKIGAPGMRLGWVRAPKGIREPLAVAKQVADLHTSTIDQAAAAHYLGANDLDAHVARLTRAYGERRDTMLSLLPEVLPEGATWSDPDGGMFTWVRLPGDVDTLDLLQHAIARDVAFVPGASFYPAEPDRATMRMSFTTHTPDEIATGLRRLGEVFAR